MCGTVGGADTASVYTSLNCLNANRALQATSSLGTFFLAMAMFPEVQRKAKQEIDAVVGAERLVTYDDWSSLPFVEALRREVMRWKPVAPLAVAHANTEDDVYKGYYIPKGVSMLRDSEHPLLNFTCSRRINNQQYMVYVHCQTPDT